MVNIIQGDIHGLSELIKSLSSDFTVGNVFHKFGLRICYNWPVAVQSTSKVIYSFYSGQNHTINPNSSE